MESLNRSIADDSLQGPWEKAIPEELPRPAYWPFFLALGLTLSVWGLLTTWVICLGGLIVFTAALCGWINLLVHEGKRNR